MKIVEIGDAIRLFDGKDGVINRAFILVEASHEEIASLPNLLHQDISIKRVEHEEFPMNCPFCGCQTSVSRLDGFYTVVCLNTAKCRYFAKRCKSYHEAVEAHNRVANAVMLASDNGSAK